MRPIDADKFKECLKKDLETFNANESDKAYRIMARNFMRTINCAIDEQPTVETMPKEATWLTIKAFKHSHYCSNCSTLIRRKFIFKPNYCPNCGRKMKNRGEIA